MRTLEPRIVISHPNAQPQTSPEKLPLDYFLLSFGLAVPIWLLTSGRQLPLPFNLPAAALVTFVPVTAASIAAYRQSGVPGVKTLWKRTLDYRRVKNKAWYLPTLLLMPAIYMLSYGVMRLTGMPLPEQIDIPLAQVPLYWVMFFIGDAGEELGWTGYAIDPMQNRWGALKGSLILGGIWATWHAVPFVLTGNDASWVLWQTLSAIPLRVLHVWIYNNTGKSVFAVILFHDMTNISWSFFPNYASHYNPLVTGIITAITAGVVAYVWGAKTLARFRFGKNSAKKLAATVQNV